VIDSMLFTEESGFVDGIVIEIEYLGATKCVEYFDRYYHYPEVSFIRPLTGPMAIWNFAPEGATVLVKNAGAMYWMNHVPDMISQHDEVILMPFWAKANQ